MPEEPLTGDTGAGEPSPLWPAVVAVLAVATLPYASFVAVNLGRAITWPAVWSWWGWTLVVGLGIVAAARLRGVVFARWVAVLVCTATWLALHAHVVESGRAALGVPVRPESWWIGVTGVLLLLGVVVGERRTVQQVVFVVATALLLVPAGELVAALAGGEPPTADPAATVVADATPPDDGAPFLRRPDVWLVVLDGHGDGELVRRRTPYDPGPFLSALEGRGFDVVTDARSNYPLTHLSIASTLQGELVVDGGRPPGAEELAPVLGGVNRTVAAFLGNGYSYVHAYPGLWPHSGCGGLEDVCLGDEVELSETSVALLGRTPLARVPNLFGDLGSVAAANDPAVVVRRALDAVDPDVPVYGFVHLLPPHPPYLRDADCGLARTLVGFGEWGDGRAYGAAVACLHRQLEDALDRILERDPGAVVVLLGDHGPRFDVDLREATVLDEPELFSVLHAVRLPPSCRSSDAGGRTNVNAMRVVLACLRGEAAVLVPDETVAVEYPLR